MKKRIVIGLSGASGAPLAIDVLDVLKCFSEWETNLVYTSEFERTLEIETNRKIEEILALSERSYCINSMDAAIASGTFQTEGMIIVPCSMKTVAGIASGYSENLLLRAADVTLKEGRKLVLVPRETPMSQVHLRNLLKLSDMGVRILPPMLTFYTKPSSIKDMIRHITAKALSEFGIETPEFRRWA